MGSNPISGVKAKLVRSVADRDQVIHATPGTSGTAAGRTAGRDGRVGSSTSGITRQPDDHLTRRPANTHTTKPPQNPDPTTTLPPPAPPATAPAASLFERIRDRLARAGWRFWERDDRAREVVRELTANELTALDVAGENALVAPMAGPGFWPIKSAADVAAIEKLYADETSDPAFYEATATLRDSLAQALANSPKIGEAQTRWAQLSTSAKVAALQEVANLYAAAFGLPPQTLHTFTQPPQQVAGEPVALLGYAKDGEIYINTDPGALNDFYRNASTVVHEFEHLFQRATVKLIGQEPVREGQPLYQQVQAFALNQKHYVSGSNAKTAAEFALYQNQPVESDARKVAAEVVAGMREASRHAIPTANLTLTLSRDRTLRISVPAAEPASADRDQLQRALESNSTLPMVVEREVEINGAKVVAQCAIDVPRTHPAFPLAMRDYLSRNFGLALVEGEAATATRAGTLRLAPVRLPRAR